MTETTDRKLRIGVSGLGRIGWGFHCRTLHEHPDFELTAVADPVPDRLREAEQTFGVTGYEQYDAMLNAEELDVVTVASPTHLHCAQALAAVAKHCHVYLEKPMTANAEEAETLVTAAERAGLVLTVYQKHRAEAYFQHICRIVESGCLGTIYHVRRGSYNCVRRNDWQALQKYGGGMLNNYGSHFLDQMLTLTGHDVATVYCNLRAVATLGDAEDVVKVVYQTADGTVAEVDINQASPLRPYAFEIYGAQGCLWLEGNTIHLRTYDPSALPPKKLDANLASANRQYPSDAIEFSEQGVPVDTTCQIDVYADLARAVRNGTPPLVPPRQTLSLMQLMNRCRTAAGTILDTREQAE